MANLAIKGSKTRGDKIIEILEQMGGQNNQQYCGANEERFFSIESGKIVVVDDWKHYYALTIDEFEERFPFKVGDVVIDVDGDVGEIVNLNWEYSFNWVSYHVSYDQHNKTKWWNAENLNYVEKLYEVITENNINNTEDIIKYNKIDFTQEPCEDKVELVLGDNYEIINEGNKTYVIKKKPQYPKTYEECCEMLGSDEYMNHVTGYNSELIESFQKLLICRDAYWKIAGEEMGLGKPWKPDWEDTDSYYTISYKGLQNVKLHNDTDVYALLSFPSKEMNNVFFENFKEFIKICKDLL